MGVFRVTDWLRYRKCRVCNMGTGNACLTRSSRIVDGRPDGVARPMLVPHGGRRLRTAFTRVRPR